jgi:hypothetical protein
MHKLVYSLSIIPYPLLNVKAFWKKVCAFLFRLKFLFTILCILFYNIPNTIDKGAKK